MAKAVTEEVKTQAKEGAKKVAKKKVVKKLINWGRKVLEKFGIAFLVQNIPLANILANLTLPCLRLVLRELKGDFTTPEGILMLSIAGIFDIVKITLNIVELFLYFGVVTAPIGPLINLITTIVGWVSTIFFMVWIYIRSGGLTEVGKTKENKKVEEKIETTEKATPPQKNTPVKQLKK